MAMVIPVTRRRIPVLTYKWQIEDFLHILEMIMVAKKFRFKIPERTLE
jgi:hypothetical protein